MGGLYFNLASTNWLNLKCQIYNQSPSAVYTWGVLDNICIDASKHKHPQQAMPH